MVVVVVAVLVMVRAGIRTVTVEVQAGAGPLDGQVLPAASEVTVLVMVLSPVSGLSTVTVKVMVADWPGARSPVQVRSGAGVS